MMRLCKMDGSIEWMTGEIPTRQWDTRMREDEESVQGESEDETMMRMRMKR
jgi:hypothetical protein